MAGSFVQARYEKGSSEFSSCMRYVKHMGEEFADKSLDECDYLLLVQHDYDSMEYKLVKGERDSTVESITIGN